ncbi:MAG: ABC transporter ATP-binding protein [Eubacteriaceae bacterium]|nr:ABC transporter ATP-binding protein [Eubacteriaceae bacterium]
MIKIPPLKKTYSSRTVLDFPGTDLEKGRIYAVIGSNGSGKSTFAKILSGMIKDDDKQKLFKDIAVGYMPQRNYSFRMSVVRNILLGGKDPSLANELMERLKISHLKDKRAKSLSGGETARMALARLMMGKYDIVILDEPTSAMDMESSLLTEELIKEYVKNTNCALILITHSLQQAKRIADDVLFFHKGSLLEYGSAEKVLYEPENAETKKFLEFYGS